MGKLRTRKRGSTWEYSFEGAKVNSKRKPISKGGFRTKAEAEAAGTQAKAEFENCGRKVSITNMSIADYLDYWLENAIKKNIGHGYAYNTYLDYESKIRLHLKPALGQFYLASIQPDTIQRWVDDFKLKGYSKSMVKNTFMVLSGAMQYAVLPCKFIKYNSCDPVRIGKIPINQDALQKQEYICIGDDYRAIMERYDVDSNFYLPIMAGYHLGTRLGESYGFDLYEDFDYKNRTISVNQQMQYQHKKWVYAPPKYDSYRKLKMGEIIAQILHKEISQRKEKMLYYGEYYQKTYLSPDNIIMQAPASITIPYREIMPLSVRENGELLTPHSFKYAARIVHHELNNPLFHYHSLRHTHGTLMAQGGASPKSVQKRLGHKDIETTLNTYIFNTEKMENDAVTKFESQIS